MGKLIVIEGTDGSGKTTQLELLYAALRASGQDCRKLDFPRYAEESSALLRMYLRGDFGSDPESVNPYAASTFFAVDRYASYQTGWRDYYLSGGVLVSNRYTTSNAVHQGAKLPQAEREKFYAWLYDYEFRLLGIPAPDMVILLDVPVEITQGLMASRRAATGAGTDIHEADMEFLRQSRQSARRAAEYYGWSTVPCVRDGKMRAPEDIHADVMKLAMELLKKG